MATKLLSNRRVVACLPNLTRAVRYVRSFSTYDNRKADYNLNEDNSQDSQTVWPDSDLGPFGPQDKRFPLPGNIGPKVVNATHTIPVSPSPPVDPVEELVKVQPEYHRQKALQDFAYMLDSEEDGFLPEEPEIPRPCDRLEYVAHSCPDLVKKDFQDLFPGFEIIKDDLTVITISQKSENDMSGWSPDVDEERETLLAAFMQGANEICETLRLAGFWADFIDPSSGKPYIGSHTNATFFETDERYRKFGFEIDDLGCCKVIRHHLWGTRCYVGCLFTNAPVSHPIIQTMMDSDLQ